MPLGSVSETAQLQPEAISDKESRLELLEVT